MSMKVVVNIPGPASREKVESVCKRVADALSICREDVVFLPEAIITVVEVPDSLVKAREKHDAQEKHDAEKKAREEADQKAKEEQAAAREHQEKMEAERKAETPRTVTPETKPATRNR